MTSPQDSSATSGALSSASAGSGTALVAFSIPPYATIYIESHVPITLELERPNFS